MTPRTMPSEEPIFERSGGKESGLFGLISIRWPLRRRGSRINADHFNLILKECGVDNSEYAAVQLCDYIEGKRSL